MRLSFVSLFLSLLLFAEAGAFAQNAPVKSELESYKNTEQRAMYFRDSMNLAQQIQLTQMSQHLDSLNSKTKKEKVYVEATETPTGTCYETAPKPWFQIQNRPKPMVDGGFQFGYSNLGTFAAIDLGTKVNLFSRTRPGDSWFYGEHTTAISLSAVGTQYSQIPSQWNMAAKNLFSGKIGLMHNWNPQNRISQLQVGTYFEWFSRPGTMQWETTTGKQTLRLPDTQLSLQGKVIILEHLFFGFSAIYYPGTQPISNGLKEKFGFQGSVGFRVAR